MSAVPPALPPGRPDSDREFPFTDDDFRHLATLAGKLAGINLGEAKRELVYARLAKRLRARGLRTFAAYRSVLDSGDEAELEAFVNAITTNHTSFFRESHHFELLRTEILPEWQDRHRGGSARVLRAWCAGCSTGEEPYTLAITLLEALGAGRFSILATDLDSSVLATAAAGEYPRERIAQLDPALVKRWFLQGRGRKAGRVRVDPAVSRAVSFQRHNMILERPPAGGCFDLLFCRNVVIYFDRPTQKLVVNRLRSALRVGGYLLVGHSESLLYRTDDFELVGQSSYRRCA